MQLNYSLASPMRPRALLHATAMCLLFAAATVWAPPPGLIPQPPPRQKPAPILQKPALPGSLGEGAESRLKKLSALPGPLGERPESIFKTPERAPALEQTAALKQRAELEQRLKQVAGPQLKLLQRMVPGLSHPFIVEGSVKQFATDFQAGAKHPKRFLSEIRLSQPALIDDWLKAPKEKRIFIIGAGKDSAKVSEWTKLLESDGYSVFFYKFCSQSGGELCSSKAVGAMFRKSGWTALYQTPFAELSKYVKVEAATAGFLEGLSDKVVLISSSDLLAAKFAMLVVNMPTPTPSPVK